MRPAFNARHQNIEFLRIIIRLVRGAICAVQLEKKGLAIDILIIDSFSAESFELKCARAGGMETSMGAQLSLGLRVIRQMDRRNFKH